MEDMTKMFGQVMCMPFTVFASTMDALTRSVSGGPLGGCGSSVPTCAPCAPAPAPIVEIREGVAEHRDSWDCDDRCGEGLVCPPERDDWGCRPHRDHHGHPGHHDHHRDRCGGCGKRSCDCCCGSSGGSDRVKLVEYSLVTVRRGRTPDGEPASRKLDSGEMVISDCTDLEQIRYQIVGNYVRQHRDEVIKDLRVYVKVLDCWCKNDVDWCEEQVDALRSIAGSLRRDPRPNAG